MRSTRTSRRRASLLGAGAAAAVLGLASTAFACSFYKGKATVSDTNNGVPTTAWADGNPSVAHSFCLNGVTHENQLSQPVDLTGSFTVTAGLATNCPASTPATDLQAPARKFAIYWATPIPGAALNYAANGEVAIPGHCNANDNTLQSLGDATVDITGAFTVGAKSVSVPAGVQPGPAAICFQDFLDPTNLSLIVLPEVRLEVL